MSSRRILKAVAFDMDGTLTVPVLDFAAMRRRCRVPSGADILEELRLRPPEERAEAMAVIKEMELEALEKLQIAPGAAALCAHLDALRVPRGLITRNVNDSVDAFHLRLRALHDLEPFSPAISRDSGLPYKPSPDPLLFCCRAWGVEPSEVLFVGDSAKDDVVTGRRAGAWTVLLDARQAAEPAGGGPGVAEEQRAHHTVATLHDVRELLDRFYELASPFAPPPPR